MIHSLHVLNKAGGLVYHQDYSDVLNKLSINDYLVFAGTIHGVHAIAAKLTPSQANTNSNGHHELGHSSAPGTPRLDSNPSNAGTPVAEAPSNPIPAAYVEEEGSRLNQLISNFTNLNNPTVNNAGLLNSMSLSYNKLNSNFFYMNSNLTGLNVVETTFFNIFIYQTLTGIKFILIALPNIHSKLVTEQSATEEKNLNANYESAEELLRKIYVLYGDYVMKNPFYSMDMPIKAELFDSKVRDLISAF